MTGFVPSTEFVAFVQGLISAKKQLGSFSLDLTVSSVSMVRSGGSLDFGGSEYRQAAKELLHPVKNTREEPYGWWKLEPGTYLIRFNEKIHPSNPMLIMILPHDRLLAAGASHSPTVVERLDEQVTVLLHVGSGGLAVKENARISRAVISSLH
ncbi:MAG: dCTP deaminase [Deltaproteobacteria bacterium]|nr:dCTP deaminase [Deltaproteobacteria bacterium]